MHHVWLLSLCITSLLSGIALACKQNKSKVKARFRSHILEIQSWVRLTYAEPRLPLLLMHKRATLGRVASNHPHGDQLLPGNALDLLARQSLLAPWPRQSLRVQARPWEARFASGTVCSGSGNAPELSNHTHEPILRRAITTTSRVKLVLSCFYITGGTCRTLNMEVSCKCTLGSWSSRAQAVARSLLA